LGALVGFINYKTNFLNAFVGSLVTILSSMSGQLSPACKVSLKWAICYLVLARRGGGVHFYTINTFMPVVMQTATFYDEMVKKKKHNLPVSDGRRYKLPNDLQCSDGRNAGCVWISPDREPVDAMLLQVRSTVNKHINSFNPSV
jgi:hypothetical protein